MAKINTAKEQALDWLWSMAGSDVSFDAINAQAAYDIIMEQNRRLAAIGAAYKRIQRKYGQLLSTLDEARESLSKPSFSTKAGYFCEHCEREVPTAVIRLDGEITRICLRCGEVMYDPNLTEDDIT